MDQLLELPQEVQEDVVAEDNKIANGFYGCFGGYGMMNGSYVFSWIFGILIIVALVLLIIWLTKQIQKDNKNTGRKR